MPVTENTLWNMRRLNLVFGISALLGLISFFWMMKHDIERPWRGMQTQYFNARSSLYHLTAVTYETPEKQAEYQKLKDDVEQAKAALEQDAVADELAALNKQLNTLEGELQGVSLSFGNINAKLGVQVFHLQEATGIQGKSGAALAAVQEEYDQLEARVEELKVKKQDLEDSIKGIKGQIKEIRAPLVSAQRNLQDFEKGLNDARSAAQRFGPGVVRTLINLPILDYAPPKGVPGRQEVKNLFMKDLRFDMNFTDTYLIDRCTTCHIANDNPDFTRDNLVDQAQQAMMVEKVAEVIKRENEKLLQELDRVLADVDASMNDGKQKFINAFIHATNKWLKAAHRPTIRTEKVQRAFEDTTPDRGTIQSEIEKQVRSILAAAAPTVGDDRPLRWDEMTEEEQERYFKSLMASMNCYLENNDEQSRPKIEFGKVLEAHPRLDLFVSPTSPHPMNKMGCTVCHEGSGQETDFIMAIHTPNSEEQREEWNDKYIVREAGIPLTNPHVAEEFWERPMLKSEHVSASCRKCHEQLYDLDNYKTASLPEAHNVVEGRDLYAKVGCINCHNIDGMSDYRKVGPDLTYVASKLDTAFLERWIEYPNEFRPSTRMPHFFKQENNLVPPSVGSAAEGDSDTYNEFDPTPVLRTETEIQAITEYLEVFSKSWEPEPLPENLQGDVARGEELFTQIGCLACHVNLDATDPLDDEGRTFAESWLVKDIAMEKAWSKIEQMRKEGVAPEVDQYEEIIEAEMEPAKADFDAMSKNDRVRYASRQFTRNKRQKALLESKTEAFLAENELKLAPHTDVADPFKLYVPPEFTRQGPELSGMGSKLIPEEGNEAQAQRGMRWLYNWLKHPRHYAEGTLMPKMFRDNYYQLEAPETQQLKNDQDMLDVAAYLLTLRNDEFDQTPIADDDEHRDMRERLIRDLLGGQNTATVVELIVNDEKASDSSPYGPLTESIVNQTYRSFGGGDEGRQHVAALLDEKAPTLEQRRKLFLGMKMVSHYGCYACHTIAGFEDASRPSIDMSQWAQKFISQLDFAFFSPIFEYERDEKPEVFEHLYREDDPAFSHLVRDTAQEAEDLIAHAKEENSFAGNPEQHILHNHATYAHYKIRNPRIWDRNKPRKPYEKSKMPNYFFTAEEAEALTAYILSRREANVRESVQINYDDTPIGRVARGREISRQLNCIGCHTIEGNNAATIHQYYSSDTSLSDTNPISQRFKPPSLWGEGAKIQNDWLVTFFNNVEMLRPWLNVRMPSFYLSNEDTTALVEYFAGLTQVESEHLDDAMLPVVKYMQQVHAGEMPDADPHWFFRDNLEDQAEFIKEYALRHEQTTRYDFDDSQAENREERAEALSFGFEKALERTDFLRDVYDIPYPFTDTETHTISDEDTYKLGEQFFYDLKCLACHVAGDPSMPGTTTEIKAPNFALTWKRLRYEWAVKWLYNPKALQPGTNMPQIFPGGKSFFQDYPEETRKEKEAAYGATAEEQAKLLVDWLFTLGARGDTAIQPGAVEAQQKAKEAAEQEGDLDIDFGGGDEEESLEDIEF